MPNAVRAVARPEDEDPRAPAGVNVQEGRVGGYVWNEGDPTERVGTLLCTTNRVWKLVRECLGD